MIFFIREKSLEFPAKRLDIDVRIVGGGAFLEIAPGGYGEPEAKKGKGATVFLELYEGELRLHYTTDINDHTSRVSVSLEGAREDKLCE